MMAAGEALVVIERQLVQLFHHTSTGRFLLLPLECSKYNKNCFPFTPRASPATIRAPPRSTSKKRKKVKSSLLLVIEFLKSAIENQKPASVNISHLPKKMVLVSI
jgi:hypothetical protein